MSNRDASSSPQSLDRIAGHAGWLAAERILRLAMSVVIGALIARSLGPEDFGRMNFAIQVATTVLPLAVFGLDPMIVKWLVREPSIKDELVGTSLVCRLALSISVWVLAVIAISFVNFGEDTALLTIALLNPLAQSGTILNRYFLTMMQGRVIFFSNLIALVVSNLLKVLLVLFYPVAEAFVIAVLLEGLIVVGVFLIAYYRDPSRPKLRYAGNDFALKRLRKASPLVPVALAGTLFLSIEYIMMYWYASNEQLGIYSAATRITGAWVLLQASLVAATYPVIVAQSKPNEKHASSSVQFIFEIATGLSILFAIPIFIFADQLILLLYGNNYANAGVIVSIHIWSGIFAIWRKLSGSWFQADGTLWLAFSRNFWGICTAFAACLFLVPEYGAVGAATGSLIGQAVSGLLVDGFRKKTRKHFMVKIRSLLFSNAIEYLRLAMKNRRNVR